MAHDTGGPEDTPTESEDEFVDIDEELESGSERKGFGTRIRETLGNAKDKYVGWHTVDTPKQDQGVAGTTISRRGFVAGAAQVGLAGYAVSEATDGDGWDVDFNSTGAGGGSPAGGGVAPPSSGNETATDTPTPGAANETETATPTATPEPGIENGQEYAFETEEELIETTGLCYPGETDAYIGAVDAEEVEDALEEGGYTGDDPSGALNAEEVDMDLDDITEHQGLYAVDVDRKQGNDGDYDLFVQLVGEEDGGLYVTREGAQQVSDMEFEEVFEGYQECS